MLEIFETFLGIVWLLLLLAGPWLAFPYIIWMIYTALKKRWSSLRKQILLPILILTPIFIASHIIDNIRYNNFLKQVFGTEIKIGHSKFSYHTPMTFNGDGYDFKVYEMPESVREIFVTSGKTQLVNLPANRPEWEKVHWREAPLDPQFKKYVDFALPNLANMPDTLDKFYNDVLTALNCEHAYYSFYIKEHDYGIGNVALFIADMQNGKLYLIHFNT